MSKIPNPLQILETQREDWDFRDAPPEDPDKFQSMFTNKYGERWWCRRVVDRFGSKQLCVWGDDANTATTKRGVDTQTMPWIMHAEERMWLEANLGVLKDLVGEEQPCRL